MFSMAKLYGVRRIIPGVAIPHPCGDPRLSTEADIALRRQIVKKALDALQTDAGDSATILS